VNECVGHFSPLKGEGVTLKDGDTVKMCVRELRSPT
jgi:methionine aminopeptidase